VPDKNHPEGLVLDSLGQLLTDEREKAGLTRSDLASKTRVTVDQIAKMEEGRFAHLPPVYARGFLKTIAGAFNVDPELFLGEYRRLSGNREESPAKPLQNRYVGTDVLEESGSGLSYSLAVVVLILAVATTLFFLNPTFRGLAIEYLPFLGRLAGASAPASAQTPVAAKVSPKGQAAQLSATLAESPAKPAASPASAATETPPQPGGRLVLKAVKATWTQILIDDEGSKRFVYFQPGQSQAFDSQKSIALIVGDGQALRAEWNGQDLGFLGPQGPLELVFPPAKRAFN
jgi:cytoskeletal protein RodZ